MDNKPAKTKFVISRSSGGTPARNTPAKGRPAGKASTDPPASKKTFSVRFPSSRRGSTDRVVTNRVVPTRTKSSHSKEHKHRQVEAQPNGSPTETAKEPVQRRTRWSSCWASTCLQCGAVRGSEGRSDACWLRWNGPNDGPHCTRSIPLRKIQCSGAADELGFQVDSMLQSYVSPKEGARGLGRPVLETLEGEHSRSVHSPQACRSFGQDAHAVVILSWLVLHMNKPCDQHCMRVDASHSRPVRNRRGSWTLHSTRRSSISEAPPKHKAGSDAGSKQRRKTSFMDSWTFPLGWRWSHQCGTDFPVDKTLTQHGSRLEDAVHLCWRLCQRWCERVGWRWSRGQAPAEPRSRSNSQAGDVLARHGSISFDARGAVSVPTWVVVDDEDSVSTDDVRTALQSRGGASCQQHLLFVWHVVAQLARWHRCLEATEGCNNATGCPIRRKLGQLVAYFARIRQERHRHLLGMCRWVLSLCSSAVRTVVTAWVQDLHINVLGWVAEETEEDARQEREHNMRPAVRDGSNRSVVTDCVPKIRQWIEPEALSAQRIRLGLLGYLQAIMCWVSAFFNSGHSPLIAVLVARRQWVCDWGAPDTPNARTRMTVPSSWRVVPLQWFRQLAATSLMDLLGVSHVLRAVALPEKGTAWETRSESGEPASSNPPVRPGTPELWWRQGRAGERLVLCGWVWAMDASDFHRFTKPDPLAQRYDGNGTATSISTRRLRLLCCSEFLRQHVEGVHVTGLLGSTDADVTVNSTVPVGYSSRVLCWIDDLISARNLASKSKHPRRWRSSQICRWMVPDGLPPLQPRTVPQPKHFTFEGSATSSNGLYDVDSVLERCRTNGLTPPPYRNAVWDPVRGFLVWYLSGISGLAHAVSMDTSSGSSGRNVGLLDVLRSINSGTRQRSHSLSKEGKRTTSIDNESSAKPNQSESKFSETGSSVGEVECPRDAFSVWSRKHLPASWSDRTSERSVLNLFPADGSVRSLVEAGLLAVDSDTGVRPPVVEDSVEGWSVFTPVCSLSCVTEFVVLLNPGRRISVSPEPDSEVKTSQSGLQGSSGSRAVESSSTIPSWVLAVPTPNWNRLALQLVNRDSDTKDVLNWPFLLAVNLLCQCWVRWVMARKPPIKSATRTRRPSGHMVRLAQQHRRQCLLLRASVEQSASLAHSLYRAVPSCCNCAVRQSACSSAVWRCQLHKPPSDKSSSSKPPSLRAVADYTFTPFLGVVLPCFGFFASYVLSSDGDTEMSGRWSEADLSQLRNRIAASVGVVLNNIDLPWLYAARVLSVLSGQLKGGIWRNTKEPLLLLKDSEMRAVWESCITASVRCDLRDGELTPRSIVEACAAADRTGNTVLHFCGQHSTTDFLEMMVVLGEAAFSSKTTREGPTKSPSRQFRIVSARRDTHTSPLITHRTVENSVIGRFRRMLATLLSRVNVYGATPLDSTARVYNWRMSESLAELSRSPLHVAAELGAPDAIDALLTQAYQGSLALSGDNTLSGSRVLREQLSSGVALPGFFQTADSEAKGSSKQRELRQAWKRVAALLAARDGLGMTALHVACLHRRVRCATRLTLWLDRVLFLESAVTASALEENGPRPLGRQRGEQPGILRSLQQRYSGVGSGNTRSVFWAVLGCALCPASITPLLATDEDKEAVPSIKSAPEMLLTLRRLLRCSACSAADPQLKPNQMKNDKNQSQKLVLWWPLPDGAHSADESLDESGWLWASCLKDRTLSQAHSSVETPSNVQDASTPQETPASGLPALVAARVGVVEQRGPLRGDRTEHGESVMVGAPVVWAGRLCCPEAVLLLLRHGASLSSVDELGRGLLHFAAWHDFVGMVIDEAFHRYTRLQSSFETESARPSEKLSREDWRCTHLPREIGDFALPMLNRADRFGRTPLHYAVLGGSRAAAQALLRVGAAVQADRFGKSPVDYARDVGLVLGIRKGE